MEKSPDAFRTISEVAEVLATPAHVLRFWETRFPQIRPVKRAGGRRYYRPSDVALLAGIKRLLHEEGLTIRGVQKILREQGVRHVAGLVGHDADNQPDAFDALLLQSEAPDPVDTVVDFPVPPRVVANDAPAALPDLFSLMADAEQAPESAPDPAPQMSAMPDDDMATEATEIWLPTHLRGLAPYAFENEQAVLVALHGRLMALRDAMTQPRRSGRG